MPQRDFRKEKARLDRLTFEERFWAKVAKGEGCWEWLGSRTRHGYGHVLIQKDDGRRCPIVASRLAWIFTHGPIPDGLHVCHHCDNPPCVRPDHLFLGTALDNKRDSIAKGRRQGRHRIHPPKPKTGILRGEACYQAKLTADKVRDFRRRYGEGSANMPTLAREAGVGVNAVSRAIRGLTWKGLA